MNINTTARHCELDPEIRLYAHERLEKFHRFARDIQEAHVVVTAEGYRHSAEITLRLKRRDMISREESTEPKLAIERAAARLEQQLRKLKEKRVSRKRNDHGPAERVRPVEPETAAGDNDVDTWEA